MATASHPESTAPSEPTTQNEPADKRFGQAFLLFGVASILMLTLGMAVQAISLSFGLVITLLVVVLLPAVLFAIWKKVPVKEALRLRPISISLALTSLLAGAGAWGIAAPLAMLIESLGLKSIPVDGLSVDSPGMLIWMLIIGAVLPGICEECLFRGAIQGVLERRGKWFAIIVAGILFGAFHMDPTRVIVASVLGIFFGWLVVRTGSLVPAILAHFGNNTMAFCASYFLDGTDEAMNWLLPSLAALCVIATFVFVRLSGSSKIQAAVTLSPLTDVPAGLPRGVAWGCGIPGVIAGVSLLAGIAALNMIITAAKVDDNALAPRVKQGDQVILMKPDSPVFELKVDEIVVFKQGDKTLARKVSRFEEDQVWVSEPSGTETKLDTSEIIGSVLQVIPSQPVDQQE